MRPGRTREREDGSGVVTWSRAVYLPVSQVLPSAIPDMYDNIQVSDEEAHDTDICYMMGA